MIYIFLLRGINIGNHNKILMKDLKESISNLSEVKQCTTYIQTGNIIIDSNISEKRNLQIAIKKNITIQHNIDVPIFGYSLQEYKNILDENIFGNNEGVYISLLKDIPKLASITHFKSITDNDDNYFFNSNSLFYKSLNGYKKNKINNNFIEKELNTIATTRNAKTMYKLLDLATKLKDE